MLKKAEIIVQPTSLHLAPKALDDSLLYLFYLTSWPSSLSLPLCQLAHTVSSVAEASSHCVAQASIELNCLPVSSSGCWDYRHVTITPG